MTCLLVFVLFPKLYLYLLSFRESKEVLSAFLNSAYQGSLYIKCVYSHLSTLACANFLHERLKAKKFETMIQESLSINEKLKVLQNAAKYKHSCKLTFL